MIRGAVAVLVTGAVSALCAASAGATGSYPGETLTLSQSGPAVAGRSVTFVASGQQADVNDYAGGFDLEAWSKDPRVDSTCAPDYVSEGSAAITDPSELRIVVGLWQGPGTTFSVPFKVTFPTAGPRLLCAYSEWVTDTAAAAQLRVNVTDSAAVRRAKALRHCRRLHGAKRRACVRKAKRIR